MPASNTLLPAASQPKPCGWAEAEVPDTTCAAVVDMVIVEVAPVPLTVTEVGLSEQVICALAEADLHVRSTVPLKPATDSRTICEVAGCPGSRSGCREPRTVKSGLGVVPAQAFARLVTFTEPSPVTWSYPTPALKPYWKGL